MTTAINSDHRYTTIKEMLMEAITLNGNGRYGCSFSSIKKFLAEMYHQQTLSLIKRTMKLALDKGDIVPVKAGTTGLSGSFKLPAAIKVRAAKTSVPKRKPQKKEEKKYNVVKGPKASANPSKAPKKSKAAVTKKNVAPKKITSKPEVAINEEEKENSSVSEKEMSPVPPPKKATVKRAAKKKVLQEANMLEENSSETVLKKPRNGPVKKASEDIGGSEDSDDGAVEKKEDVAPKKGRKAPQSPPKGEKALKTVAQASVQSDAEAAKDDPFVNLKKKMRRNTEKN